MEETVVLIVLAFMAGFLTGGLIAVHTTANLFKKRLERGQ
jgi:uncharacterized protein YneF (UPF0154 family)